LRFSRSSLLFSYQNIQFSKESWLFLPAVGVDGMSGVVGVGAVGGGVVGGGVTGGEVEGGVVGGGVVGGPDGGGGGGGVGSVGSRIDGGTEPPGPRNWPPCAQRLGAK
jgi:hypothetical protein